MKMDVIAENFVEAQSRVDIIDSVRYCAEHAMPIVIIGGGSNIVFSRKVINGLIVLNRYYERKIIHEDDLCVTMQISSGYPMSILVKETVSEGLSGFEYHLGLPGSLGGAIAMNSKWVKTLSYVSDTLIEADIINPRGEVRTVDRNYFCFSYGHSILQETGEWFVDGIFKLLRKDTNELIKIMNEAHEYRILTQPHGVHTSGCYFKNIHFDIQKKLDLKTNSAGYLIDQAGLKGYSVGDFYVSDKHANFIINKGKGNSEDLRKLVLTIKDKVKEKFGIVLEEEVISI